ncbi:MAG: TetR/AcrR family transcriptional regulator [Acidobacteriota bacterium]|nr:TetR/AcrR family transcriptional regulator [Acidobacteriota bacterium]
MSEPPPSRRRRKESQKSRATRDALVELAAEMFAEGGYVQTSIRDISRRAEVTSGAIYGHFRNKADLLAAAISARTTDELEARSVIGEEADYIDTLTRLALEYRQRRQLRALILQGAAAAQTDEQTRQSLRDEQLSHLEDWLKQYEEHRDRMGIHPSVDMEAALLYTWAVELGLGVLEGIGIEPRSVKGWSEVQNRLARSLQLPPDPHVRRRRPRTGPAAP